MQQASKHLYVPKITSCTSPTANVNDLFITIDQASYTNNTNLYMAPSVDWALISSLRSVHRLLFLNQVTLPHNQQISDVTVTNITIPACTARSHLIIMFSNAHVTQGSSFLHPDSISYLPVHIRQQCSSNGVTSIPLLQLETVWNLIKLQKIERPSNSMHCYDDKKMQAYHICI